MSTRPAITADSLNAVDLFRGLAVTERRAIAAHLAAVRYPAGRTIVTQDDVRNDVYFILGGSVRAAFHGASGRDVQFRDQHAGEMFGELSAIDGRPRSAEVSALTEVFLAVAGARDFVAIASTHPEVARRLFAQLAERVRALSDRVVEFSTLGVSNRIHGELLRLAREHGSAGNTALIRPAPTHADIASRVSTHREAVTREIAALARDGILVRGRGQIAVSDVARLEALVAAVTRD
ncbi:MAG: Crp/Fnr family transcriptional regulator [Gammaproteobacteria bacterium]